MEKFLDMMTVCGTIVAIYFAVIYFARKWIGKPGRMCMYIQLACMILSGCSCTGDSTLENWVMLIAILAAWFKELASMHR